MGKKRKVLTFIFVISLILVLSLFFISMVNGFQLNNPDSDKGILPPISYESNNASNINYSGYIIEFTEPSLIEKQKSINVNNGGTLSVQSLQVLSDYKNELKSEHNNALSDIKNRLNPQSGEVSSLSFWEIIIDFFRRLFGLKVTGHAISETQALEPKEEFYNVFNGIYLNITDREAEEIKQSPYVKAVYPNTEFHIEMMDSVPFTSADKAWQLDSDGNNCTQTGKQCLTGKNITIAIIDTGIDYTHPDLGNCTQQQFLTGTCSKVIGGYDFLNNDNDPMDDQGHGSHVAGIAAGTGKGGIKGIAPDAKIYAYKVCDTNGMCSKMGIIAGIDRAVDPNNNGDFSDHANIISMSLGYDCEYYDSSCGPDDFTSTSVDNAVDAGVIVVIAGGNSGPHSSTIGTPATARKAITVGASYNDNGRNSSLHINGILLNSIGMINSAIGNINTEIKNVSGIGNSSDFSLSGNFNGKIALIKRGDLTFAEKVKNAQYAGAVGVIIYNNKTGPIGETASFNKTSIPAITISLEDGTSILNNLSQGKVYANLTSGKNLTFPDTITDFSSRGPIIVGNERIYKPDIVAPGYYICSAQSSQDTIWQEYVNLYGNGTDIHCFDSKHIDISGTSMSTPMVAGIVALIKQSKPTWNPQEIKDALRNTAIDMNYSVNDQGFGLVNLVRAINLKTKPLNSEITTNGYAGGDYFLINGTAMGEDFSNYSLYYQENGSSNWIEICSSNNEVINSILCNWNIVNLNENIYSLKLIVRSLSNSNEGKSFSDITIANTKINKPRDLNAYRAAWDYDEMIIPGWFNTLNITGNSEGHNFNNYNLTLCDQYFNNCSNDSIILSNNGKISINDDLLGILNLSKIKKSGYYQIVLYNFYNNKIFNDSHMIDVELSLKYPWPKEFIFNVDLWGNQMLDQPTFSDVNNDGKDEIIISYKNQIDVLDSYGNILLGWPVIINSTYNIYGTVYNSSLSNGPAVGDLNNDGKKEIVVVDDGGYVHVFYPNGTYVFPPKQITSAYFQTTLSTPVIADLKNDNNSEIIIGDTGGYLHVLDKNGNELSNWPKYLAPLSGDSQSNRIPNSVSIGDINGDGKKEIIAVSTNGNINYCTDCENYRIWAFDYQGNIINGWPKNYANESSSGLKGGSNVILADFNNDKKPEIIFGLSKNCSIQIINGNGVLNKTINIYENPSPYGCGISEPSIGDLDNDGKLDITFIAQNIDASNGCLFAYYNNGTILNNYPICIQYSADNPLESYTFWGIPSIVDLYNNNMKEIISPMSTGLVNVYSRKPSKIYAYDINGNLLDNFPKYLENYINSNQISVDDIDKDGKNELIIPSWSGRMFVYSLEGNPANNDWSVYHYNAQHTGYYNKLCLDVDKDGIFEYDLVLCPNGIDLCPYTNTSYFITNPSKLNNYLPDSGIFNISNNINGTNIFGFDNFSIKYNNSKISFKDKIKLISINSSGCFEKVNLSKFVIMQNNQISINSSYNPEFNKSSTLIFYGINYISPKILKDGSECTNCQIINYTKGDSLEVDVSGFSKYEVIEGLTCSNGICDNNETCSTCPQDCGTCQQPPSNGGGNSGGGSGGSSNVNTLKNKTSSINCTSIQNCSWSPCINNTQRLVCIDEINCKNGTRETPESVRSCNETIANSSSTTVSKKRTWVAVIIFLIIILLLISGLIVLMLRYFKAKKEQDSNLNQYTITPLND